MFASDPDQHICELQLVHDRMLTARKQCNAHQAYVKCRSALELLETFGIAPGASAETQTRWRDAVAADEHSAFVRAQEEEYAEFLFRYQRKVGIASTAPPPNTTMEIAESAIASATESDNADMSLSELQREVKQLQKGRRQDQAS